VSRIRAIPAWVWDSLALAAGLGLALAFAPVAWRPLALLAPVLGIASWWAAASPTRAAWRGWLFGVGLFGFGASWIYHSLHTFGGAPPLIGGAITMLFVATLALFPAGVAGLGKRLGGFGERASHLRLVLVWPGLWVLAEWLRGWVLTGFPWLNTGASQVDTWLRGYGPVLGVYGISLILWIMAGLLVLAAVHPGPRLRVAALLAGLALGGLGYGLDRLDWTRPVGQPVQATLVQGNASVLAAQSDPTQRERILARYANLTQAHWSSDLIVWPETAMPDFFHVIDGDYLDTLDREARAHGTALISGVFQYDFATGAIYNAMVGLGTASGEYRKRRLVPFGEYFPLRGLLEWLAPGLNIPAADIAPGAAEQASIRLDDGTRLGVSICYEDAFGREIRRSLPEAAVLINASNDGWFGDSIAPHQHLEIARMRSVESGRPMLRATNTGVSAIIGARGEVIGQAPQFVEDTVTVTVQRHAGITPFIAAGYMPSLAFAGLAVIAVAWRGRRRASTGVGDARRAVQDR